MDTPLLKGSVAVVTGAAGGIGRAFAQVLSDQGAAVVCADLNEEEAIETALQINRSGGKAVAFRFDQTDASSVAGLFEESIDNFGKVDILINNAAMFSNLARTDALDIEPDEWDRVIRANLTGPFLCCRTVLPHMIERRYGKIVNISSSSIFRADNRIAHYVSAKMGVIGLTRALAREYSDAGITINALSPGPTDSGSSISTSEYLQSLVSRRSIRRIQVPGDLTGAVLFLSSHMSDFMTGQHLVVDGGSVFQ